MKVSEVGDGGENGRCQKVWKSSLWSLNIVVKKANSLNTSRDRKSEREYVAPRKETAVIGDKCVAQKQISCGPEEIGDSAAKKEGILGQVQGQ